MKIRLDVRMVRLGLVPTRSQAESHIKLGFVLVNKEKAVKPGMLVSGEDAIIVTAKDVYVSRAGRKLASVAKTLRLNFSNKVVLDVGSSTGGFTDYALQHGAKKVIAVDVGTNQLNPSLRTNSSVELHEQTDIRVLTQLSSVPDVVVIDVSFISLREILPHIKTLCGPSTLVIAMVKPQFEAGKGSLHKGVIKNSKQRRQILGDFETWVKNHFVIDSKADSAIEGTYGNIERFYLLRPLKPANN